MVSLQFVMSEVGDKFFHQVEEALESLPAVLCRDSQAIVPVLAHVLVEARVPEQTRAALVEFSMTASIIPLDDRGRF